MAGMIGYEKTSITEKVQLYKGARSREEGFNIVVGRMVTFVSCFRKV